NVSSVVRSDDKIYPSSVTARFAYYRASLLHYLLRQYLAAVRRHKNRVLVMRGGQAVRRAARPAVGVYLYLPCAHRYHGLYGKTHTRLKHDPRSRVTVVLHGGIFVHVTPYAVTGH